MSFQNNLYNSPYWEMLKLEQNNNSESESLNSIESNQKTVYNENNSEILSSFEKKEEDKVKDFYSNKEENNDKASDSTFVENKNDTSKTSNKRNDKESFTKKKRNREKSLKKNVEFKKPKKIFRCKGKKIKICNIQPIEHIKNHQDLNVSKEPNRIFINRENNKPLNDTEEFNYINNIKNGQEEDFFKWLEKWSSEKIKLIEQKSSKNNRATEDKTPTFEFKIKSKQNLEQSDTNNMQEIKDKSQNNICFERNKRKNNSIVAIKTYCFHEIIDDINKKIKDPELKLTNLCKDFIININRVVNMDLFYRKLKDILSYNNANNARVIEYIYKNKETEKDAYKLFEMTFEQYYEIFKIEKLAEFLKKENEKLTNNIKQRKYKTTIEKLVESQLIEDIKIIEKFILIRDVNKKGRENINPNDLVSMKKIFLLEKYNVELMGNVSYEEEMQKVFKSTKINIKTTLRANRTGIPLRIVDILGCGGFMLSTHQAELDDFFFDGEVVYYETTEEAVELMDYYLAHDDEREKVASAGLRRVKEDFSFEDRIEKMLGTI